MSDMAQQVRVRDREKEKIYRKRYNAKGRPPENPQLRQARRLRYRARNPEKQAAQVAVANAINRGRLQKQTCVICGNEAQAHHEDYSRKLDVIWLCPFHHNDRHRILAGNSVTLIVIGSGEAKP